MHIFSDGGGEKKAFLGVTTESTDKGVKITDVQKGSAAEKAGLEVIKVTGSYDYWVAKAYILLGDVYMQQKDYFNAEATFPQDDIRGCMTFFSTD